MNVFPVREKNQVCSMFSFNILFTNDDGKPLFEYDVLVLGHVDLPRLLIDPVIAPPGVETGQLWRDPVVLPHEDCVKGGEPWVLSGSRVTRHESPVHFGQDRADFAVQVQRFQLPLG